MSVGHTRGPRSGGNHGADVRRGSHDVIVPLLAFAVGVVVDVKRKAEAIDLQSSDVAQTQVGKISHQLSVEPERDLAVALPGRVRLEHVLVAVPAIELGGDV